MILLLGASGYLGQAFTAELRRRGIDVTPFSRKTVDYTRFDVLFNYVRGARPEFIINTAGYPGNPIPGNAGTNRAEIVRANTLLPLTIARVCYLTNTPWGHVSSGCIYSGAKIRRLGRVEIERNLQAVEIRRLLDSSPQDFQGFDEADEPNSSFRLPPTSFYTGTKALAEEALHGFSKYFLWRPGLVFDECDHPRNFLTSALRRPSIPDSVNSFTHRADFARVCLDLWQSNADFGVYHIVNPGVLTGRQVVQALEHKFSPVHRFELEQEGTEYNPRSLIDPPSHCMLDSTRLRSLGIGLRPISVALQDSLASWIPSQPENSDTEPSSATTRPPAMPS